VTVPAGVPSAPVTVAVSVTFPPSARDEGAAVSVVALATVFATVILTAGEVEAAKPVLPL
jgi:hypothetical protein